MKQLISYFIRYKTVSVLTILFITVLGVLVFSHLRYSFFPAEKVRFIDVDIIYIGASPSEVEDGAIAKIEDNLKGVRGIDRFTSVSQSNRGRIEIELLENASADDVLLDVQNAIDSITSFPDRMEEPVVTKRDVLTLAMVLAISGDEPLTAIKDVTRRVEDDFLNSGIFSNIQISGYPEEEIEITIRENDLRRYNLTLDDVSRAVSASNLELFGGTIKSELEDIQIKANAREYFAGDLGDIIILAGGDGREVRLADIATLRNRFADQPEARYLNGKRAVSMVIQNTNEEDILKTVEFVRNYVEEFNESRKDLQITIIADQAEALEERVEVLADNAWQGALLVLIVLAVFLNFRLAAWVALKIPISILGMIIFAGMYGVTVNQLSMFGVILVLGILVDYGVVVSENIYQKFEQGKNAFDAALEGTMELISPILISFVTTVAAFAFFFFLDGRLGEFFSDVSFVVVAANIVALLVAFFIIPALVANSRSLLKDSKPNRVEKKLDNMFRAILNRGYAPALRFSMRHSYVVFITMFAFFLLTAAGFRSGLIQGTFFPNIEFDEIAADLRLPAGTSEDVTEEILQEMKESVEVVNQRLKEQESTGQAPILYVQSVLGPQTNTGRLEIRLTKPEERDFLAFEIASMIREEVGPVPEAENLSFGPADAFGKPISISMTHRYDDLNELREVKSRLSAELNALPSAIDVIDTDQLGLRELNITLKPEAELLGLNLAGVMNQVRQGFFGIEVQSLQRGDEEVKVWLRYSEEERSYRENLENALIRDNAGRSYFLKDIANIEDTESVVTINRRDGLREISVEADVATLDTPVPAVIGAIQSSILPDIREQFPNVEFTFEGQSRESQKTAESAQRAGPIILIIIIFMILLNSRSYIQMFLTLFLIPFSIIGVAWGHVLQDIPLSIFSILGIIALIGILINNILVFLTTYNDNLRNGQNVVKSIYMASLSRFKPIMLTAITTAAGLTPLLLGTTIGAQFLKPTAVSVFYGLLFATFLTLGFLPLLLLLTNRIKQIAIGLFRSQKPTREEVEPAVEELKQLEIIKPDES
jgi:multidrug efflux pump subunit AcrB